MSLCRGFSELNKELSTQMMMMA